MSRAAFDAAMVFILAHEGGLVDDPADPGGLTHFGISQLAYPQEDIRAMTPERAASLYLRDYWLRCELDRLPDAVAVAVMDAAVNQGPRPAVELLQAALRVTVDGRIGPQTASAAYRMPPHELLPRFFARRAVRYATTAGFDRYGFGWMRRCFECYQAALGLVH